MHHPLEKFLFCPVCGNKSFNINDFKSKKCGTCGFTYYANPCSATAAFILNDRGDMGETVEDGMKREIQEETGLTVTEVRYLFSIPNQYLYSDMLIHTIDMFYEIHVGHDVKPVADDDAAALQWIPLAEVNPKDFGLKSISKGVERYLAESLRK